MEQPILRETLSRKDRELVVIVVNYRTPELLTDCLTSIEAERRELPRLRVVIVDGGSGDESVSRIPREIDRLGVGEWVTFQPLPINGGFGYANNQAILSLERRKALPDVFLLLNPDARLLPGSISSLLEVMDSGARIGAVGGQIRNSNGEPVRSAFVLPSATEDFLWAARNGLLRRILGRPEMPARAERASATGSVTGAAILLRREALREVGLFNDSFFLYFEETELCSRLWRAGWEVWTAPSAIVLHKAGSSTKLFNSETGEAVRTRLPRYWYESWQRYHHVTRGRAYATFAALAFSMGWLLWAARCVLQKRPLDYPPSFFTDFWRARASARLPNMRKPAALCDMPGGNPKWMQTGTRGASHANP